jgi:hypothetical protein
VPNKPPETDKVVDSPLHIAVVPEIAVGAMDSVFVVVIVLEALVEHPLASA